MRSGVPTILLAGVLFGTIPVFSTPLASSGVGAEAQVAWRLLAGTPILVVSALLLKQGGFGEVSRRDLADFAGTSCFLLAMFLSYIGSLSLGTPAATAVLLLYCQPVFTVILSRAFSRARLVAIALGVAGLLVVLNPQRLELGLGPALALLSGILYAVYLVLSGRLERKKKFGALTITALSFSGAAVLLAAGLLVQASFFGAPVFTSIASLDVPQLGLVLGLVLSGTVFPYLLINSGLRRMAVPDAGITLLIEPLTASALGIFLLGQGLSAGQVVGGALIAASIIVVWRSRSGPTPA